MRLSLGRRTARISATPATCRTTAARTPIFEPVDGHDHIFFGATSPEDTNAGAGDTLRVGHLTACNRRENNFLAYWLPEVYRNGSTTPLPVDTESKGLGDNTIYYRAGDVRKSGIITVFPSDFEIVARDDGGQPSGNSSLCRTIYREIAFK